MSGKINAKDELLSVVDNYKFKIIGAEISFGDSYNGYEEKNDEKVILPLLYSDEDYKKFLKFLDRKYDSGYGGQNLFGIVVCENGVWLERGEYDGSEWWNVHEYPDLGYIFGEKNALKYNRKKKLDEIEKIGELKNSPIFFYIYVYETC